MAPLLAVDQTDSFVASAEGSGASFATAPQSWVLSTVGGCVRGAAHKEVLRTACRYRHSSLV
jgi:hypothetical protein